jgi:hypothetical protein
MKPPSILFTDERSTKFLRFDWSVNLMLNSSALDYIFKKSQEGGDDCKERCSSCVLILTSKDQYTNINMTKEVIAEPENVKCSISFAGFPQGLVSKYFSPSTDISTKITR